MQLAFLTFLPSIYLSGLLFPIGGMGARHPVAGRGDSPHVLLEGGAMDRAKGVGLEYLWPNLLPFTVFGVAVFTLAVLRFRKQLD